MRRHGVSYIAGFNNQMTSRADSCHITRVIFPLKKFCCVVGAWHLLLVGVAINLNLFGLIQSMWLFAVELDSERFFISLTSSFFYCW